VSETDEPVELSRLSRSVYRESENPQLRNVVQDEDEEAVYGKKKRFVGWKVFDKKDWERGSARFKKRKYRSQKGEEYTFKLDKEKNVAGIIGPIGEGKTVLLRGISNRGFEAGIRGIHLADVKGDMQSNNYKGGVQKKIENLRELEQPKKIPTKMLMPVFIREYKDDGAESFNQFFQFEFDDLTQRDFKTMMPTDTDNKAAKVEEIYDLLEEGQLSIDGSGDGEDVLDWLEEQDMNYSNRSSLKTAIKNMRRRGVIGTDHLVNVASLMKENNDFISINMSGHEDIDNGFPQMYVGKNVRDLSKAKKNSTGEIPKSEPLEMYLDEAHEFLQDDNVAEKWITKCVKKDRYLKFRLIWATHMLTDFDDFSAGSTRPSELPEIVFQTKHFFITPGFGSRSAQILLDHCGLWRTHDTDMWREIFSLMKQLRNRGIYVWLYMNTEGNWCVFESASSLANHG